MKQGLLGDCWFLCACAALQKSRHLLEQVSVTVRASLLPSSSCLPCTGRKQEARQLTPVCCGAVLWPLSVGHGTEPGSQATGALRRRCSVASPAGAQRGAFCPALLSAELWVLV